MYAIGWYVGSNRCIALQLLALQWRQTWIIILARQGQAPDVQWLVSVSETPCRRLACAEE